MFSEEQFRKELEERRKTLEIQLKSEQATHVQAAHNINAIDGAIQDVDHWIKRLDKVNEEAEDGKG